jgi:hypothetical protein
MVYVILETTYLNNQSFFGVNSIVDTKSQSQKKYKDLYDFFRKMYVIRIQIENSLNSTNLESELSDQTKSFEKIQKLSFGTIKWIHTTNLMSFELVDTTGQLVESLKYQLLEYDNSDFNTPIFNAETPPRTVCQPPPMQLRSSKNIITK